MSDKTPTMAPQSPSDAAVVAALEGRLAPIVQNAEGLAKGEGDMKPGDKDIGAEQDKANGGQQEPLKKTDDDDEDDEEEDDDEEEEDEEKGFTDDDLVKAKRAVSSMDREQQKAVFAALAEEGHIQESMRASTSAGKGAGKGKPPKAKKAKKAKKAYTEEDLSKAFDRALAIADGVDLSVADRRQVLSEKLAKGELDDDEREELMGYLRTPENNDEPLERSYADMASDDPDIASAPQDDPAGVDVSGFLQRFATFLGGSLDEVNESVEKGFARTQSFNRELAKGMVAVANVVGEQAKVISDQGDLLKALSDRLERVEKTPIGRQSVPTSAQARQLQRGFGVENQGEQLSKGERLAGLTKMNMMNRNGVDPVTGIDLQFAITTLEGGGSIPPALDNEIRKALGK